MNMMGGKWRQGRKIAESIRPVLTKDKTYYEPFCGALSVAIRISEFFNGKMIMSDANESLINMWKEIFRGWEPPDIVTEEMYNEVKNIIDPKDPMTAYCGHGMSFGGKWFGGYARNNRKVERYTELKKSINFKKQTILKTINCNNIKFKVSDYSKIVDSNQIFYLDPPYSMRTKAYPVSINGSEFWDYARSLVKLKNWVFITEFKFPNDFTPIYSFGDTIVRYGSLKKEKISEQLIIHKDQLNKYNDIIIN